MITIDYEGEGQGVWLIITWSRILTITIFKNFRIIFGKCRRTRHKLRQINIFHKIITKVLSVCAPLSIDNYYTELRTYHIWKFTSYTYFNLYSSCTDWRCRLIVRFSDQIPPGELWSSLHVRLACRCFIISSKAILELGLIQKQAVAQFICSET